MRFSHCGDSDNVGWVQGDGQFLVCQGLGGNVLRERFG